MTESTEQTTYRIPSWNFGKLQSKIDRMNRKADQIGCPHVSIEVIATHQHLDPDYVEECTISSGNPKHYPQITVYEIIIHGEGPKIEGWKFVGTLDHCTLPGSVIVKTVPDEAIPERFFHVDAICNHCDKIRRRNDTFVLEGIDENVGQMVQVGRNCLKDFFGHDPSAVVRFLASMFRMIADFENEEQGWGGGGRQDRVFDHIAILQATAAVIKAEGWVPKSASAPETGREATASLVMNVFIPPQTSNSKSLTAYYDWKDSLDIDNEQYTAEAKNARAWLSEQEASNEYMHNLHQIDGADAVPLRMFGFWCSLVAAYQRAQERLAFEKAEKKGLINEYLPGVSIKNKVTLEITLISIRSFDGMYGTYHIHKMLDTDGRTLIWFANARPTMEEGKKYQIRGTVKKLDEYNGQKQTTLSRVRILT